MSYKFITETIANETSKSASFYSDTVDLLTLNTASFQVNIVNGGGVSWTIAVQGSNDGVSFIDTATPTAITTTTNTMLSIADVTSRYYRVAFTRTSGTLTSAVVIVVAKG